ncbi:undecaprenyl-diphosphate phosphatase [Clostridium tyrobutyricum]|jgi:undecaprenyl-diphosphatase|uniref:undecaprenyl-diphosphate phosphatase n=1 Tax=Clostridium tyrobutyricum TaxID=1519 RepID=UPI0002D48EB4|nr:undecaprenyl-diphosphate phosphatase [Clostridium tyrobutyricum]MBR9649264.1 undecaprenyl-diphosphate phosphatase [Clostridium tyrobutyricum]MBV4415334.1 undecaprenyl-diphosphate phosphatase [Clostridium tyrobutyricum]MBV4422720.1 undecaprenyl-diphosphate phosphatase [Clostridium tyrobutyricum]MBV4426441.1 undecaprenyl-diphosphate phosphatase [Clostridium tyrobutyricum]MBV4427836.1 undecaprenyl-diphosphate phosphatase [Clostridium tyrobutyricum]
MYLLLIIKAIVIGIVEGITEFLPISSTGHMIIVGDLINFKDPTYRKAYVDMFEIVIQLGAILAILVLYWNKISGSLKNLAPGKWGFKLWCNIIIAFIPAAVIGFLLDDIIQAKLFNSVTVACALIFGGFLMIFMEKKYRRGNKTNKIEDVTTGQAIRIGCFQCIALWPGMSRSASTIMGAWTSGLTNVAAAEFSFILAIPTMIAATGYSLGKAIFKSKIIMTSPEVIALVVGFVVSFIVALFVVDGFISFLKKKPMRVFAIYRIFIGILVLILSYANIIHA